MIATLEQIHSDPGILDRAISRRERLDIVSKGVIAATFTPTNMPAHDEAGRRMSPGELGVLAEKLADAPDDASAAVIREEMTKGFYGEPHA